MRREPPFPMPTVELAPTHALSASALRAVRALLDAAFDGEFSDEDWQHATGGVHVCLIESREPVAHAALVERTLVCSGRTLRAGYVEAVATAPARRRMGHGTAVMARVGDLIRGRYPLGALSTGRHGFYDALGWERWRGPTFVHGPAGRVRTPDDDGGIMILRTARTPSLDPEGDIVCDWRPGDVW